MKIKAATAPVSDLVTVKNIPMISTGIDYPVSTGIITVTAEMLQDVVMSQDDPAIHPPRTKLGHDDPRFNLSILPNGDVLDGEPSLGTWINLHLDENGQTLMGDLAGCPRWLADIMATAYPNRSIEGNFDVETVTGHKWKLCLNAVALLGVIGPGITTLDDLPLIFSEEGPDVVIEESEEGDPMSVIRSARGKSPEPAASNVQAQVNVDDVRRQYYSELDQTPGTMWWWIRAIYMNPMELIVDDDEGGLYRVGFTIGDDDSVVFSDPAPVKVQYVDAPAAAASQALRATLVKAMGRDRIVANYTAHAESRNQKGGSMTPEQIALLRARLGLSETELPDDADDAVIMRVLATENSSEPDPSPSPDDEDDDDEEVAPAASAPQIPEGMVLVDAAAWSEVRQQAQAGAGVAARLSENERDQFLDEAVKAGKFPPSRREHYLAAWVADPTGTRALVDSLSPGLVPVSARGTAGGNSQTASDYDPQWLSPRERVSIATARNGGVPVSSENGRVTVGGD